MICCDDSFGLEINFDVLNLPAQTNLLKKSYHQYLTQP